MFALSSSSNNFVLYNYISSKEIFWNLFIVQKILLENIWYSSIVFNNLKNLTKKLFDKNVQFFVTYFIKFNSNIRHKLVSKSKFYLQNTNCSFMYSNNYFWSTFFQLFRCHFLLNIGYWKSYWVLFESKSCDNKICKNNR